MKTRHLASGAFVDSAAGALRLRAVTFRAVATRQPGQPLIWTTAAVKGAGIEANGSRYALCAVHWCGFGGSGLEIFRARIADTAEAARERVALPSVHQHRVPYVCPATRSAADDATSLRVWAGASNAGPGTQAALRNAIRVCPACSTVRG